MDMMEGENARRNLRDFLSMYNQFTETCFDRCIHNLNYRVLTQDEESCTMKCVTKLINVNHREISQYMEINPLNRRLNDLSSEINQSKGQTPPPDLALEGDKALGIESAPTGEDGTGTNNESGDIVATSEAIQATESTINTVGETEKT